jgi:hypothetical protein
MRPTHLFRLLTGTLVAAALVWPAASMSAGAPTRLRAPVLADLAGAHQRVRDRVIWTADRAPQGVGRAGFWGGKTATSTGESVNVFFSDTYPVDTILQQRWVEFFASLVHGSELGSLTVYIEPLAELQGSCRSAEVDGCYFPRLQTLYIPAEDTPDGATSVQIATHEYGHHIATNRLNTPWFAGDTGTKRWASYMNVCARTQEGTAFPGDEGLNYTQNPGEAFAETYRILNEQRAGATLFSWPIVDDSWFPDQTALDLLAKDVTEPWTAPVATTTSGTFRKKGPKVRTFSLSTPLDGTLNLSIRSPRGGKYQLMLLDKAGQKVLAHGSKINYTICGSETLTVRVTKVGAAGKYTVQALEP